MVITKRPGGRVGFRGGITTSRTNSHDYEEVDVVLSTIPRVKLGIQSLPLPRSLPKLN